MFFDKASEGPCVPSPDATPGPGRPMSCLGDAPCLKKSRLILKEAVDWIESFAKEQNIDNEQALDMLKKECER